MAQSHKLGKRGEDLATSFLISNGYRILERNYRWQKIEVDIIAQNSDYIIFVEVKTRTKRIESPEQFFPKNKQSRLVKIADNYVLENNIDKEVRFDLIIIDVGAESRITHYPSVFVPIW